ncbi:MAG: DUF4381 domain-containing protein [Pseudomonadota bacterium]
MDPEQIPLRDLHLPEAIGWWPLAPGWWVVIALAIVALGFLFRAWLRIRARGAARRYALRELNVIELEYQESRNPVQFGANLSELLRRTMLAYAPRHDVAGLTGDAWLEWLDEGLAQPVFSNGPGRQIVELPYRNPDEALNVADVDRLLAAVRHRVATPVGGKS